MAITVTVDQHSSQEVELVTIHKGVEEVFHVPEHGCNISWETMPPDSQIIVRTTSRPAPNG
jgi:hypothetical protein